jgi:hypothetical protein
MPRNPSLRSRLADLPDNPTAAELKPIARGLARSCAAERYPQKSLAATLRHLRPLVTDSMLATLGEIARTELEDSSPASHSTPPQLAEGFIGLAEASRRLNLAPNTLLERLREPRFRKLYGWPWWDGHQWTFSPDAVDPALRAQHLATLPDHEPSAHVDMLPPWCERETITPE